MIRQGSEMWALGRHATRAVSTLRRVKDTRRIGTSSVLLTAPLVALGTAAFALRGDDVHAQSEAGGRVSPPLSKEHMRLARRFTRRNNQKFHRYVIVGCGTAAHAAIEAIRQGDPHADILILSDERALPRLESRRGGESDAHFVNDALLETYNEWRRHIAQKLEEDPTEPVGSTGGGGVLSPSPVTLLMKKNTTMHFDVEKNRIVLSDGTEIQYEKCLIACSGRPRHFYVLDRERISYEIKDRINTCTTLHDFEQLDALSKRPDIKRVTIVGGGFLGTEVATALATDPRNAHLKTQLLFVEAAPGSRSLPSYLAKELARRLTSVGIDVVADRLVTSLKGSTDGQDDCVAITAMGNGKHKLKSDYVVLASTHTEPNLRLDRQHCFEVDDKHGGIKVNAQLEAMAGVFVAGNAASYYDPYLGRRRVDRYDHAVNSGLLAGRNMVASGSTNHLKLYRHQPVFRSDLKGIDVQIEGIGEIDASFHTVGVWVQPLASKESPQTPTYERGVVYYLKGNKIMGILLWNAPDVMESARQFMLTRPEVHENVIDELKEAISLGPDDWLHVIST